MVLRTWKMYMWRMKRKSGSQSLWPTVVNSSKRHLGFSSYLGTTRTTKFESREGNDANKSSKKQREYSIKTFIKDDRAAQMIIEHLKVDVGANDVFIEVDSGKGVLTKQILSNFENTLLLFKPSMNLLDELNTPKYRLKNCETCNLSFYSFYKYYYESRVNPQATRYKKFVETLKYLCPPSSRQRVVGVVCHTGFLYSLLCAYTYQCCFFEGHLKPTFYLFVPYNIYSAIFKLQNYYIPWRMGVLVNIYFEVTLLGSLPKTCFHNLFKSKNVYGYKKNKELFKHLFLLKLSPKDFDTINKMTFGQVISFQFFISYLIRRKSNLSMITSLEAFIPNCGKEFIKNGFKMFDCPHGLSEAQWFKAFEIFTSHPDFENSIYLEEMKRNMLTNQESVPEVPLNLEESEVDHENEEEFILPEFDSFLPEDQSSKNS